MVWLTWRFFCVQSDPMQDLYNQRAELDKKINAEKKRQSMRPSSSLKQHCTNHCTEKKAKKRNNNQHVFKHKYLPKRRSCGEGECVKLLRGDLVFFCQEFWSWWSYTARNLPWLKLTNRRFCARHSSIVSRLWTMRLVRFLFEKTRITERSWNVHGISYQILKKKPVFCLCVDFQTMWCGVVNTSVWWCF